MCKTSLVPSACVSQHKSYVNVKVHTYDSKWYSYICVLRYISKKSVPVIIHLHNIIFSNDLDGAIELLDKYSKEYSRTPAFTMVLEKLIVDEDATRLQKGGLWLSVSHQGDGNPQRLFVQLITFNSFFVAL